MTYAIQLTVSNGKKYFGYRNYKGAWTTCMTVPEATTFKTEKGAWRALQNGDKFVKLEYACSCWQDSLQREGYDVDVVNVDDQKSAEVFVEAVEQSVVEPVVEVSIIPIGVYPVHTEVYIKSNFPSLNKQDWITDYHSQAPNICQAKIVKIVHLSLEDYRTFLYSLLSDQEWLAKEGGSGSRYISEKYKDDYDKLFKDKLEADRYRNECYEISVLVTDGSKYILANPEGFDYAQYVGLPQHATLEYILEKSNIKLLATSAAEPVALPKLATNLIAFPTLKQPEAQSVPQLQSSQDSDDYVQVYREWVDKLVARGEYSKIKSYDEWYAIASEVM